MIYYLNRGFIAEQALADIVQKYFLKLKLDDIYKNFHITVTNNHPFAHLILHESAENTADYFPTVVITTQNDNKVSDLINCPVQLEKVGLTSNDIDFICNNKRIKTKFVDGEEVAVKNKAGQFVYEMIPGYCCVLDDESKEKLKAIADEKGFVYGINYVTRKRDRISVEIWADNNQLKNEIYEQLRLYFSTVLNYLLKDKYEMFDPSLFDGTVSGERSNNFNFDFDCALYGSHITFDLDYNIGQMIIDTELNDIDYDIIPEVINHVKE